MNIIRMTGGLGNQMFQYALYLKLKAQGKEVKFDDKAEYKMENARPILLWAFGIEYPVASKEEIDEITDGNMGIIHRIRRKISGRRSMEYHENDCNFDQQVLSKDPAYLTGYFQSEKYFAGVEEQVRKTFCFTDKIWQGLSREALEKIKTYERQIENQMAVSVHIRRGDYLENDEKYGGICTDEYYGKAIEVMQQKLTDAVFFVFSNEPEWVKKWIARHYEKENNFVVIEGTTEATGYLDLFLMSRCKHHIIANSSFSWWGAWLNPDKEKMVIAPDKWINHKDMRDIYTKEMIKI